MSGLVATSVRVRAGARAIVDGVDLEVAPGTSVALIGPNGAGKSTLLRAFAGVASLAEGRVLHDGVDVHAAPRREVARRIAWMPPHLSTPFAVSVLDTVLLGRTAWLGPLGLPTDADRADAREALASLGVAHLADRAVTTLSSGERQRVHLAAVLVQRAPVWLLDEPTSAQDLDGVRRIFACVERRRAEGAAIVVALHDLSEAARRFDRVVVLHEGRVVADGAPRAVFARADVRAAWDDAWDTAELDGELIVRSRRT